MKRNTGTTRVYYTILYYNILYYNMLYYDIIYHTIIYYTMLCYAIQNTVYYILVLRAPMDPLLPHLNHQLELVLSELGAEALRRMRMHPLNQGSAYLGNPGSDAVS